MSLVLRPLVYVMLTIIISLEQSSNNRKAGIVFLARIQDLGAILGTAENSIPLLLCSPIICPHTPRLLDKCYISCPCSKFLAEK